MKKSYDDFITPQNVSCLKLKRLLHVISNAALVVNLVIFAILLPDVRLWTFALVGVFVLYTVAMLLDKRKSEWAWWGIVFGIAVAFCISLCYVILFKLYLYFAVIAAQAVVLIVTACGVKR